MISKFSNKAALLAAGIGLSTVALAGSQAATAQSYSGEYACPVGSVYDQTYGCTVPADTYAPFYQGYPYGAYGFYEGWHHDGWHREFEHGFGRDTRDHDDHGMGLAHSESGGFGHSGGGGHR